MGTSGISECIGLVANTLQEHRWFFNCKNRSEVWQATHYHARSLKNISDILFSSLAENYLEDISHRVKPTTVENKRFIINGKLLPYFGNLKVCGIDHKDPEIAE